VSRDATGFIIRDARTDELAAIGALTSDAYEVSSEFTGPFSAEYDAALRDAVGRASTATVLAAVDADGTLLGTATLARRDSPNAHVARGDEQELRMVGVDAAARDRGVGTALVEEAAFRAGLGGGSALVISVFDQNAPASRLYARLGFVRDPGRDWVPEADINLEVSTRALHCPRCGEPRTEGDHAPCDAALALEPPRFCPACRRRMTVQVRPTGWTATCSTHGTATR